MSAIITVVGKDQALWTSLRDNYSQTLQLRRILDEQQLLKSLNSGTLKTDVVLLDLQLKKKVPTALWVHAYNPNIQIVILCEPAQCSTLRRTITATDIFDNQIDILSNFDINVLSTQLRSAVMKSKLRQEIKGSAKPKLVAKKRRHKPSQNNNPLNTLLSDTPIGIINIEAQGLVKAINPYASQLFDHDDRQIVGKSLLEFFTDHERSKLSKQFEKTYRSEASNETLVATTKEGKHLEINILPTSPQHKKNSATVVLRNITAQILAERSLLTEREQRLIVLHFTSDGVLSLDSAGKVKSMNPSAEQLTGWSIHEAREKPIDQVFRLLNEESGDPIVDPAIRCLKSGSIIEATSSASILVDRWGQEYIVECSAAPIHDNKNQTTGAILIFKDVTEQYRMTRTIVHQASHDELTGLLNRQEFELQLEHALIGTRKQNIQHALCILDLDQFKIVNARVGHLAGDALIKHVATLLSSKMHSKDTLARIGGDEFGLLFQDCSLEKAEHIAESLVDGIRKYRFIWEDSVFEVGVSVGLVPVTNQTDNAAQLLTQADLACFTAKDLGRNRIHIYRKEDTEAKQRHREMIRAASINDALKKNRFRLYCQPIVSLSSPLDQPVHYEILLRLINSKGNIVLPKKFIPAAERYGLMSTIDQWVISNTLRTMSDLELGCSDHKFAINLSGNSLRGSGLLEFISNEIKLTEIDPEQICFEITETAAIGNLQQATHFITEMKQRGFQFALDDFGSGLSSFTYLKNLPVDYLKIDGSFVLDITKDTIGHAMVEAINHIGHVMGIDTIAECAENDSVVDKLRDLGVDYAQGYALGTPVPITEICQIH